MDIICCLCDISVLIDDDNSGGVSPQRENINLNDLTIFLKNLWWETALILYLYSRTPVLQSTNGTVTFLFGIRKSTDFGARRICCSVRFSPLVYGPIILVQKVSFPWKQVLLYTKVSWPYKTGATIHQWVDHIRQVLLYTTVSWPYKTGTTVHHSELTI